MKMSSWPVWVALALALGSRAWAGNPDIIVVVDMSPAGRRAPPASPQHHLYYAAKLLPYQQVANPVAGEPVPSSHDLVRLLAPELAKRGYFVVDAAHPQPDLLLEIGWGSLNASSDDGDDTMTSEQEKQRRAALVLGNTIKDVIMPESYGHSVYMEPLRGNPAGGPSDRYFIAVSAWDWNAYSARKKRVLLWQAKMSIVTNGVYFTNVMPQLIKAGGPQFGRESLGHPVLVPSVPAGRVEVGEPTVKPEAATAH